MPQPQGDAAPAQVTAEELALALPEPEAAQRLVDPEAGRFDGFYPPRQKPAAPTTDQAIDRFLENYGSNDPAETSTLERLIFNPVPDYSQQLAAEAEGSLPSAGPTGDSREDRINRFILSQQGQAATAQGRQQQTAAAHGAETPAPQIPTEPAPLEANPAPPRKPAAPEPAENSLLSESLAKIYIRTRRYDRAYEILTRLSLAVPEKNAYFADQLRFLRKLMAAEKLRQSLGKAAGAQ